MVSIPRVISNKTALTGLAQSAIKSASLFKPAPGALDKMGKAVGGPTKHIGGKMSYSPDFNEPVISSGLGRPFFVPKHSVGFR